MWWKVALILVVLWLMGLAIGHTMGGLIHILILVAILTVFLKLIQGTRPSLIADNEDRGPKRAGAAVLVEPDDLSRLEGEGGLEALEP